MKPVDEVQRIVIHEDLWRLRRCTQRCDNTYYIKGQWNDENPTLFQVLENGNIKVEIEHPVNPAFVWVISITGGGASRTN